MVHFSYLNKSQFKFVGSLGGLWTDNYYDECGTLNTHFQGNFGYKLEEAKQICAAGCNAIDDCFFGSLYYIKSKQTCYLDGNHCGNWSVHGSYHVYQKGIDYIVTARM